VRSIAATRQRVFRGREGVDVAPQQKKAIDGILTINSGDK
jgi:hypothetical protein